jgi:outer membrane biosynthesis protein TonB
MVLVLVFAVKASASGQEPKQQDLPTVITAVAPNYFPSALHSHASGEVVVAVKIAADCSVTSTEAVSGNSVLAAGSMQIAKRWKFAPTKDKNIRNARLTFVYHLVPRDTPADELLPIFKPPYRVEVVHVLPDETPLP